MINPHLNALLITLLLYTMLGISHFGCGRAVLFITTSHKKTQERIPITSSIWVGWACTIFIFQLIHLFAPLTLLTVAPIFAVGAVISAVIFTGQRSQFAADSSRSTKAIFTLVFLAILLVATWIAFRSMLPPANYDSGLYHFNAIRWMNSYPIIPGLGNLHGRLAFNQSFFAYVAALNLHPFWSQGRSIANSFLVLLTILTLFETLLPIVRKPRCLTQLQPAEWMPALFCLPLVAYWALSSQGLASPSPDLTSILLQLVTFVMLGKAVGNFARTGQVSLHTAAILILLTATAITTKVSNLAWSSTIMVLVLIGVMRCSRQRFRDSASLLSLPFLIILLWLVRGFILSGAPLYPSTIGYVPVDWAIPISQVSDMANWVYSWARQPGSHWSDVLDSNTWFIPWLLRAAKDFTGIVYPLGVSLIISLVIAFWKLKARAGISSEWVITLPFVAGLFFWFWTAPDPRFANALFLLLPICVIVLFITEIQKHFPPRLLGLLISVLFIVCSLNLFEWAYHKRSVAMDISRTGWHDIEQAALVERITDTGLRVWTPATGDQCWDAHLLCTPNFNPNLRLRNPYDISSGFTVLRAESTIPGMPIP